MITHDQLKEVLHYCPETGVFTWLVGGSGRRIGVVAGTVERNNTTGKSYHRVCVHQQAYYAHRLAFLYMAGALPENEVDHIDGNGCNNVWRNLRAVTPRENAVNRRKPANNTSGTVGVAWHKQARKWHARIVLGRHDKSLGFFHNKEDAIAARKAAEVTYNFHENHGTERPL